MGDKYTLKRSVIKKRPKKRGKYKKKPHDPKKPSTQDEKDEKFMGYKDMNRLSKGITESNYCIICEKPEEDCACEDKVDDLAESFVPPANWGRLMSNNKQTQLLFEERLQQQRTKFSQSEKVDDKLGQTLDDMWKGMTSNSAGIEDDLSTRLQSIQDRDPSFLRHLTYLVQPILDHPDTKASDDDDVTEGKRKHRAETSFDKMDASQIQGMCRKRFGLMSLEALLNLIDRMNQATSGRLHTGNKQET